MLHCPEASDVPSGSSLARSRAMVTTRWSSKRNSLRIFGATATLPCERATLGRKKLTKRASMGMVLCSPAIFRFTAAPSAMAWLVARCPKHPSPVGSMDTKPGAGVAEPCSSPEAT